MHVVAFRGMNDYYLPGVEFEPADPANRLFRKVTAKIVRYDWLCKMGISQPGLLAVVLFKQPPTAGLRADLVRQGFRLVDLPRNPYLETDPLP